MNNAENRKEHDPFNLERFKLAQKDVYARVIGELRSGKKRTHWMWYIFPQISGLGTSEISQRYSIKSREEVQAYLAHPVLGARLLECSNAILGVEGRTASEIFGYPDDIKLKSSMTLFAAIAGKDSVFIKV